MPVGVTIATTGGVFLEDRDFFTGTAAGTDVSSTFNDGAVADVFLARGLLLIVNYQLAPYTLDPSGWERA